MPRYERCRRISFSRSYVCVNYYNTGSDSQSNDQNIEMKEGHKRKDASGGSKRTKIHNKSLKQDIYQSVEEVQGEVGIKMTQIVQSEMDEEGPQPSIPCRTPLNITNSLNPNELSSTSLKLNRSKSQSAILNSASKRLQRQAMLLEAKNKQTNPESLFLKSSNSSKMNLNNTNKPEREQERLHRKLKPEHSINIKKQERTERNKLNEEQFLKLHKSNSKRLHRSTSEQTQTSSFNEQGEKSQGEGTGNSSSATQYKVEISSKTPMAINQTRSKRMSGKASIRKIIGLGNQSSPTAITRSQSFHLKPDERIRASSRKREKGEHNKGRDKDLQVQDNHKSSNRDRKDKTRSASNYFQDNSKQVLDTNCPYRRFITIEEMESEHEKNENDFLNKKAKKTHFTMSEDSSEQLNNKYGINYKPLFQRANTDLNKELKNRSVGNRISNIIGKLQHEKKKVENFEPKSKVIEQVPLIDSDHTENVSRHTTPDEDLTGLTPCNISLENKEEDTRIPEPIARRPLITGDSTMSRISILAEQTRSLTEHTTAPIVSVQPKLNITVSDNSFISTKEENEEDENHNKIQIAIDPEIPDNHSEHIYLTPSHTKILQKSFQKTAHLETFEEFLQRIPTSSSGIKLTGYASRDSSLETQKARSISPSRKYNLYYDDASNNVIMDLIRTEKRNIYKFKNEVNFAVGDNKRQKTRSLDDIQRTEHECNGHNKTKSQPVQPEIHGSAYQTTIVRPKMFRSRSAHRIIGSGDMSIKKVSFYMSITKRKLGRGRKG